MALPGYTPTKVSGHIGPWGIQGVALCSIMTTMVTLFWKYYLNGITTLSTHFFFNSCFIFIQCESPWVRAWDVRYTRLIFNDLLLLLFPTRYWIKSVRRVVLFNDLFSFEEQAIEHESAVILQIPARFYTRISVIFDWFYSLECYIRGVFAELKNNLFGWS